MFNSRFIFILFIIACLDACNKPTKSYCTIQFIDESLEQTPNFIASLKQSKLNLTMNYAGAILIDTTILLTSQEREMMWQELNKVSLITYYSDGPEIPNKQINKISIQHKNYEKLVKLLIMPHKKLNDLWQSTMLKAQLTEQNFQNPAIRSNEIDLDSMIEEPIQ